MNMQILIIGKLAIRADWRNKRRPCFVSPWWAATVTLFSSAGFFFLSNNEICSKYLRKFDRKGYFSYLKKKCSFDFAVDVCCWPVSMGWAREININRPLMRNRSASRLFILRRNLSIAPGCNKLFYDLQLHVHFLFLFLPSLIPFSFHVIVYICF